MTALSHLSLLHQKTKNPFKVIFLQILVFSCSSTLIDNSMQMMAYRHGFLVSLLYLIFLLDIHSAALNFVPVFYKSTHLPTIQFSWHGLGSSG